MKPYLGPAGYKLLKTGLTLSVLLSPKMQLGVKYKINVVRLAFPYDVVTVDAWTLQDGDELRFYFADGNYGPTSSLGLDEAKRQMLTKF